MSEKKENNLSETKYFNKGTESNVIKQTIGDVYEALSEKGYNPVSQIVGYIMSGDPTYITSHNGARANISKVERDELVEELLKEYIKSEAWKDSKE